MKSLSDNDASLPGHLSVLQGRESAASGQWVSALIAFDHALSESDTWNQDPDFLNDRAVALFHNQRPSESMALLDRAIHLQPDYGYRFAARGWMKQALKDFHGAISDYQKALALDPEDAITQNNLGLLEEQMGRFESAKERFAAADAVDSLLSEDAFPKGQPNESQYSEPPQTAPPTNTSRRAEIFRAIFTREGRREFVEFLLNGFKLND